ncbi:MAG: sigma-54-dependent Fis family transcriptional regulator [Myxococcales bacterium]|nr:sigma-54-dependent Fis family transcriptional regulator [Myxococcales bacterium]
MRTALANGSSRLLIVEDDPALLVALEALAARDGYSATIVATMSEAIVKLDEGAVDVVLTDYQLPDGTGMQIIEHARKTDPRIATVAMTAYGTVDLAVKLVRAGAYDVLTKPVEPSAVRAALSRAIEARSLRGEVERLRRELATNTGIDGIVGKSSALADIVDLVRRVADSPSTVLVTGPSGSGKERVARALHQASRRSPKPFVAINMAAVPDTLLESELFGHVKGAFTDARADKPGIFVQAEGGTLLLDEVGDLPLALQAKLLRVLAEREVRPVGANKSVAFDVRVVAATHHDLRTAVKEGRFRQDLFYRLAVIEVHVPPLRDRPEDVLPLAEHFLRRASERAGRVVRGLSREASQLLVAYSWPGNARELENVIERAVALSRDEWIAASDLPPHVQPDSGVQLFERAAERLMTLDELQRGYVAHVLERLGGNKKRAAAMLGINRRTIQRWMGESLEDKDEPDADG